MNIVSHTHSALPLLALGLVFDLSLMGAPHAIGGDYCTGCRCVAAGHFIHYLLKTTGHLIVFDHIRHIAPCLPRVRLLLSPMSVRRPRVVENLNPPLGSLKET
jgi:hypothetical protein